MARKGRNIYKRKDGRWEGRIILGYDMDGKRRYHSVYGRNFGETKQKMQEYTEKYADSMEKIKDAMASVGAASEEGSKEMIQVSELLSSIDVDMKNIEHLTGETFSDISVMNRDLGSYQV